MKKITFENISINISIHIVKDLRQLALPDFCSVSKLADILFGMKKLISQNNRKIYFVKKIVLGCFERSNLKLGLNLLVFKISSS